MSKTFASFSFGCRVNQAEKEMLDRELLSKGFSYDGNNPALFLINTCAVTAKAQREARQLIYQLKRKLPATKIIVTGCAATKWIKENTKIDGIDRLIDNVNKEYIGQLLKLKVKSQKSKIQFKSQNFDKYLNSGRLLLKIQDGCQRFCTFCIVPYLRGQPKSKRISEILTTIKQYNNKTMALILTAINTQAFGYDTGETFIDLIKNIIKETDVPRISFGSIHPWSIGTDFFKLYKTTLNHERLVKFFHIPLQSGSNKILSYMKRNYTREEFIEKLNTLYKIHPFTFIGTDIIVGFLEETDRDFEDTYDFLDKSPVSKFHVFRYSKRDKTAAFYMAKRLKEPTPSQKSERAKALINLSSRKYHKFLEKHINHTFPALFLEKRIDGYEEALLNNQIPVLVKTAKDLRCEIREVKITKLKEEKLFGLI